MSDTEKQEGQKTVVAFIAGLLIGGLLVWAFSSSPEDKLATDTADTSPKTTSVVDSKTTAEQKVDTTAEQIKVVTGAGAITIADQSAGSVVLLGAKTLPAEDGWIAVRDYTDGTSGSILGAARYSVSAGLMPELVSLLRSTEPGMTYEVVYFTEDGDRIFDLTKDTEVEGVSSVFKAQ